MANDHNIIPISVKFSPCPVPNLRVLENNPRLQCEGRNDVHRLALESGPHRRHFLRWSGRMETYEVCWCRATRPRLQLLLANLKGLGSILTDHANYLPYRQGATGKGYARPDIVNGDGNPSSTSVTVCAGPSGRFPAFICRG